MTERPCPACGAEPEHQQPHLTQAIRVELVLNPEAVTGSGFVDMLREELARTSGRYPKAFGEPDDDPPVTPPS